MKDAEIVCYHFWVDTHLRIASVDAISNEVTFVTPSGKAFVPLMAEQLRAAMALRSKDLPPEGFAREAEAIKSKIVGLDGWIARKRLFALRDGAPRRGRRKV